ncbi:uncharacterized protein LOC121738556 isoform X2 [Aricia agestis]|uniref:uncharacterized protein LOC121738556 isoform X2 n=1 Tax=Aricia agestis TaxID=91739 RepID=UPI001C203D01|nr:uncharacterized protein LOC121738556 isoform X2 [Aricia agestis]
MDASASKTNSKNIFGFYALASVPYSNKHKNCVTKYTRLPDFDFDNKDSGELKSSAKSNILNNKNSISSSKLNCKNKYSKFDSQINVLKRRNAKEDNVQIIQSVNISPKMTIGKSPLSESKPVKEIIYDVKNKLNNVLKKNNSHIKSGSDNQQSKKCAQKSNKVNPTLSKNVKEKYKPNSIRSHVPKETNVEKHENNITTNRTDTVDENKSNLVNRSTKIEKDIIYKDMNVGTEPLCDTVDHETEMSDEFLTCNNYRNILSYDRSNEIFDSLDIPNVSLRKEKDDLPKEEIVNFFSKSLPNIRVPALNMISMKKTQNEQIKESLICNNNSYIISRATVTYTSKQKIDFQVVENHDNKAQNNLRSSPLNYPISVVSVYKKELSKRECDNCTEYSNNSNNSEREKDAALNCPYNFDSDELKKPSDIISTIKVENSLLQNSSACEQFQRELNFIDSFFESLQYLETCSLSDKSFTENNVENWINSSYKFDCGSFLSKLENDVCADENETMASKSLCRLNLLIRHEQRRAKNLLFVLKMREDALKDFTKSQILWLENKKKQENTDISTLKKKQRGALLKWQHECGEMQRIRKALLTRSEKRKIVLMKTKKNLEWKLENNLDVEKIILGKKKVNRVRSIAPVKCFDLSSSGCDDSTTSRPKSLTPVVFEQQKTGVEKCIQTGDSILETISRDKSLDIANEHFIVVDGGFLNIIFKDLSLPQIFSDGKQYEVNEEAIKNILNSSHSQSPIDTGNAVEKLMDQIKNHEADNSSTPSTARSLVEEFDQYYKGLLDEENESKDKLDKLDTSVTKLSEVKFVPTLADESHDKCDQVVDDCMPELPSLEPLSPKDILRVDFEPKAGISVAGPLPVPAGAAAVNEPTTLPAWTKSTLTYADSLSPNVTSIEVPAIATSEAEELRRQELAIEREIKAIEQQQCQFLVVREIPDKPPPPYTPPIETRPPKPPRSFSIDITTKERIRKYITEPDNNSDSELDAFKLFVKDFCKDSMSRQKAEQSDKVWDICCMVPPKPQPDTEKLVNRTALDLKEVLTCVTPTILSGVGARRSDHIDDILFAEWRRCEPEWTSLHSDEIVVKNQLFECLFNKILTEAIDDYKNTVIDDN